jgi:putative acetyltransferase
MLLFSDTRFARGHAFYVKHGYRRLPGSRNLCDASATLEYFFARPLASRKPSP